MWLIFLIGYFHFFAAIIFMLWLKTTKRRIIFIAALYLITAALNIVGLGIMGWVY